MAYVNRDRQANMRLERRVCEEFDINPKDVDITRTHVEFTKTGGLRAQQVREIMGSDGVVAENEMTGRTTIKYPRIYTNPVAIRIFDVAIMGFVAVGMARVIMFII